jgi:predicted DCC family thiol-disulfide oxidoreductase YuxK
MRAAMRDAAKARTVYFDGACPVCSREVALYRRKPGADAMEWVDVSACGPDALGPGLTRDAALARMHVRTADGHLVSGAAAFAAIWRGLPGLASLGRALSLPVVAQAAELGYRLFLRLRRVWR